MRRLRFQSCDQAGLVVADQGTQIVVEQIRRPDLEGFAFQSCGQPASEEMGQQIGWGWHGMSLAVVRSVGVVERVSETTGFVAAFAVAKHRGWIVTGRATRRLLAAVVTSADDGD